MTDPLLASPLLGLLFASASRPVFPPAEMDDLFDPLAYQGVAQAFIDRLIASTRK